YTNGNNRFNRLSLIYNFYTMIKREFQPDWVVHPGQNLKRFLETFNISQKELSLRIGMSEKHIVDIIKGNSPITPDTTLKLENVFPKDIAPASFWNNLQLNYDVNLARIRQKKFLIKDKEILSKFSYSDLVKNKVIDGFSSWEDKIVGLRNFFGVSELGNIGNVFGIAYRKTGNKNISGENLSAWLRYGDLESGKMKVNEFDKTKLKSCIDELKSLIDDVDFGEKIIKVCARCGIKVVFTPYITKTYVNGATRWIGENPVLQLNIRGKYADLFWFTFFHELGHILLHGKKEVFLEFDKGYADINVYKKEKEANIFASNTLIPSKEFEKFFNKGIFNTETISEFASKIGVNEGIIAGRLAYCTKNYSKYERYRQKLEIV
ncbi:MAG: HigA family addiction module antitoxin, partial [Candidatus Gracilibacteria bacterium]|nr:HigA family addiction module antitoxin [Candidatus Gracilibacteria bacterium]